jgi:hypothetical protein
MPIGNLIHDLMFLSNAEKLYGTLLLFKDLSEVRVPPASNLPRPELAIHIRAASPAKVFI